MGYLISQLGLHLPRIPYDQLFSKDGSGQELLISEAERLSIAITKDIDSLPVEFKAIVLQKKIPCLLEHKKGVLYIDDHHDRQTIHFKKVLPDTGFLIQKKLHYLKNIREDTMFHYGLFREDARYPFSYVSFSKLDRNYLFQAIPRKLKIPKSQIYVLTRFFSVNNSPFNTTSVLISQALKTLKKEIPGISALVTTLNPNIFFSGASFYAANFTKIAHYPFIPKYLHNNYVTRKTLGVAKNYQVPDEDMQRVLYDLLILLYDFQHSTIETTNNYISTIDYNNG